MIGPFTRWFELPHCEPIYERHAPFYISASAELEASAAEVFAILEDTSSWPRWFPDFKEARWTSAPPHGVGSTREAIVKPFSARERFTRWEEGQRMTFSVSAVTFPIVSRMMEDYRLFDTGEGRCRLVWTIYYEPGRLFAPLHRLIRPGFEKMARQAMSGLEGYVRQRTAAKAA